MKPILIPAVCVAVLAGAAVAAEAPKVYFIAPANGAKVSSPVKVVFGLSGMGVAPAGVTQEKTGHHHLLINTDLANPKAPIPKDDKHLHFGGGQTEASVTLPPGRHTLQLVLGDFAHVPHNPPVQSEKIAIEVK